MTKDTTMKVWEARSWATTILLGAITLVTTWATIMLADIKEDVRQVRKDFRISQAQLDAKLDAHAVRIRAVESGLVRAETRMQTGLPVYP